MANITDMETHKDFISAHVNYYMQFNNYKYYVCGKRGTSNDVTCWFSANDFTYKSTSGDYYTFSMNKGIYYMYDESALKYSVGTTTQSLYLNKENSIFYTNSEVFKDYITYERKDFLTVECNNETECDVTINNNQYTVMLVYMFMFVLLANFFYKVVFK